MRLPRLLTAALAALGGFFLPACDGVNLPEIKPGITAQSEVQSRMGEPGFVHRDADGSVTFWVPVTGSTTADAHYPRSELRETRRDGSLGNWLHASADNYLSAVLRIDQVPSLNKVVIGQIHSTDVPGSQNDPLVKLQYHYRRGVGRLELLLRDQPGDTAVQNILLAENVQLGERFGYDLRITPSGLMLIS